jgi:hypothetical protein
MLLSLNPLWAALLGRVLLKEHLAPPTLLLLITSMCAVAIVFAPNIFLGDEEGGIAGAAVVVVAVVVTTTANYGHYYGHYYGAHSSSQYPSSFVLGPTPQNSAEGSALTGGSSGVQHACLAYGTPIFGTLDRPRTGAMLPKPVVGTACFDSRQVLSRWATRYVETPRPGATRAERDTSGLVPPTRVERKGSTPYL